MHVLDRKKAEKSRKAMLSLMCLYAASQPQLYIAYTDKFRKLADWLLDDDDRVLIKHTSGHKQPDVCGRCGVVLGVTHGGRIRDACPVCKGSHPAAEQLLTHWWPTMMDSIFQFHHEIAEGYLAEALVLYGEMKNARRRAGST